VILHDVLLGRCGSVNTVNTHVRSIYAKLQGRDRSLAVQRAREQRLLAAGPRTLAPGSSDPGDAGSPGTKRR
jgi:hypothetical protein